MSKPDRETSRSKRASRVRRGRRSPPRRAHDIERCMNAVDESNPTRHSHIDCLHCCVIGSIESIDRCFQSVSRRGGSLAPATVSHHIIPFFAPSCHRPVHTTLNDPPLPPFTHTRPQTHPSAGAARLRALGPVAAVIGRTGRRPIHRHPTTGACRGHASSTPLILRIPPTAP